MSAYSEIKQREAEGKVPTRKELKCLLDIIENIGFMGCSKEDAIEHTKIVPTPRGKKSIKYQVSKHSRDLKLARAASLLEGSDWNRCIQLGGIIQDVNNRYKYIVGFEPKNEIERLIIRSIKTGVKPLTDTRQIYNLIFLKN